MAGSVIPVRVGEVELLVETARVSGTESTSASGRTKRVVDAFDQAQDAIVAVSVQVAQTVSRLAARSVRPERVDVEFGLKFSAKGDVIIAGGSAEVALKVVIGYDAARAPVRPSEEDEDDDSDGGGAVA